MSYIFCILFPKKGFRIALNSLCTYTSTEQRKGPLDICGFQMSEYDVTCITGG